MRNRLHIFLALLTVLVIAADAWIWLYGIGVRRDPAYRYRPASLADLYIPAETLRIAGFRIRGRNELEIRLLPPPADTGSWTVTDDRGHTRNCRGRYPQLLLLEKEHTYTVAGNATAPVLFFTIRVDYYPRELYARQNSAIGDTWRIVSASLPVGDYGRYRVSDFADPRVAATERQEVLRLLHEEAGIRATDSSREKIKKISTFLLTRLDGQRGIPAADLDRSSPLASYRCAVKGTSAIWCAQFAEIYALFANLAGVPTRLVSVSGRMDGVVLGAHGFTESYLRETGEWVYVDLFTRVVLVENDRGRLLNGVDLLLLPRSGSGRGITATVFRDRRLQRRPWPEVAPAVSAYLNPDATLVFSRPPLPLPVRWRRLEMAASTLMDPDLAFSLNTPRGGRYYLTLVLSWTGILLLLFWLFRLTPLALRRGSRQR